MKLMKTFLVYAIAFASWFMLQQNINMIDPMTMAPEDEFIQLNDVNLHFLHAGQGKGSPVLLIHGFGGWSRDWTHTIPILAESHEVFALDLPGWGLSEKPADFDYSIEAQAEFVLDFMAHFGLDNVDLIGNSMGGGIAVHLTTQYPNRVRKLILIDSVGYEGYRIWHNMLLLAVQIPGISYVVKPFLPIFPRFRHRTQWLFGGSKKVSLDDYRDHYLPLLTEGSAESLVNMVKTLRLDSVQERIASVNKPTLILWGEKDPFMHVKHAYLFEAAIEGSELVVFPGIGHVPQTEVPQQVNALILEFLSR